MTKMVQHGLKIFEHNFEKCKTLFMIVQQFLVFIYLCINV